MLDAGCLPVRAGRQTELKIVRCSALCFFVVLPTAKGEGPKALMYLLYGENQIAIDHYLESVVSQKPNAKKLVFDDFKDLMPLQSALLERDSLFGEKNFLILKNFPKGKVAALEKFLKLKAETDLAFCYYGRDLSLAALASWVRCWGGEIREFRGFYGRAAWRFLDAVSARNLKEIVLSIKKMAEDKEDVFLSLAFLATRLEKLILAKEDSASRLFRFAPKYSYEELLNLQESLLALQVKLKSEIVEPWDEVEEWGVLNVKVQSPNAK